jgi:hypothetical protein
MQVNEKGFTASKNFYLQITVDFPDTQKEPKLLPPFAENIG